MIKMTKRAETAIDTDIEVLVTEITIERDIDTGALVMAAVEEAHHDTLRDHTTEIGIEMRENVIMKTEREENMKEGVMNMKEDEVRQGTGPRVVATTAREDTGHQAGEVITLLAGIFGVILEIPIGEVGVLQENQLGPRNRIPCQRSL